jgi:hypothetical protein
MQDDQTGIVSMVCDALKPLIDVGTISDVRLIGLANVAEGMKPLLSVAFASEQPQLQAGEVSRLLAESGLDVEWQIAAG